MRVFLVGEIAYMLCSCFAHATPCQYPKQSIASLRVPPIR
ncbi:hypothetical protein TSMEX_003817 [Taenia solium]|eukprot:TsM_000363000 transcript=TsM_000363000 gene=TsM_000363000